MVNSIDFVRECFFLYHSLRLTVYLFSLSKYNVIWGYTFKQTNIEPGCVKQEQK